MNTVEFWTGWPGTIIAFATLWTIFEVLEAAIQ